MSAIPIGGVDEWLATRPDSVRTLAAEFPLGSQVDLPDHGGVHYCIGYTEDDQLILSPVHPGDDYDASMEARVWLCADHIRGQQ